MTTTNFSRCFSMPNKNTFQIKCIHNLIQQYYCSEKKWIDPFARTNSFKCIKNDLNPEVIDVDFHLESLEFIGLFDDYSLDGAFFDPPYSLRQIKESYEGVGKKMFQEDTQSWFSIRKKELSDKIKLGGYVISFGWNSSGMGKKNGFEIIEVLLVNHGGNHYDTIVTVEQKTKLQLKLF